MQRIILHWTGGGYQPGPADLSHYHYIIDGSGALCAGQFPARANQPPLQPGRYAAHTLNANSGAIGLALAAMKGARQQPFHPGPAPVRPTQLTALAGLCAALLHEYGIPLRRETVLTHAEVQPLLGIVQRGKWDITWLPGMERPGDPVLTGDRLRQMIGVAWQKGAALPPGLRPLAGGGSAEQKTREAAAAAAVQQNPGEGRR